MKSNRPNLPANLADHSLSLPPLGGMSADEFLRDYWQKKPLLIRGAIPGFGAQLSRDDLLALAQRDDVESRAVLHDGKHWQLDHGPFSRAATRRWKGTWTALVQGVNLVLPEGDALLRRFSFIPHARLDDLMVSYATDGGGVGPHLDNYDVFLLQGTGRRRWRISHQSDVRLVPDAPLKILSHFKPEFDWVLEPGDMLYLPPEWAHDGTAQGECMTWSIGFRAAPTQEIAESFLSFLQDHLAEKASLTGRYTDPDLRLQKHPAEIGETMVGQVADMLANIRWDAPLITQFLGTSLSEPKPHVFFDAPESPLTRAAFAKAIKRSGLALDLRSRMLFAAEQVYLNGESHTPHADHLPALHALADTRELDPLHLNDIANERELIDQLYDWYDCGFVHVRA
jgi:50S ribosomal protein L16 3-hydroxylase